MNGLAKVTNELSILKNHDYFGMDTSQNEMRRTRVTLANLYLLLTPTSDLQPTPISFPLIEFKSKPCHHVENIYHIFTHNYWHNHNDSLEDTILQVWSRTETKRMIIRFSFCININGVSQNPSPLVFYKTIQR